MLYYINITNNINYNYKYKKGKLYCILDLYNHLYIDSNEQFYKFAQSFTGPMGMFPKGTFRFRK